LAGNLGIRLLLLKQLPGKVFNLGIQPALLVRRQLKALLLKSANRPLPAGADALLQPTPVAASGQSQLAK